MGFCMYALLDEEFDTNKRQVLNVSNNEMDPGSGQLVIEYDPQDFPNANIPDVYYNTSTENFHIFTDNELLDKYKYETLLKSQDLAFKIIDNYNYRIEWYHNKILLYDLYSIGTAFSSWTQDEKDDLQDLLETSVAGKNWLQVRAQNIEAVTITTTLAAAKAEIDTIYATILNKYNIKLKTMEIVINGD